MASFMGNGTHNDGLEEAEIAVRDVVLADQQMLHRLHLVALQNLEA
jgi:hypothetical protein